ncbi:MAG: hypothetical protein RLZZ299_2230 [Pseudomonadota bacterium]|jgi:AcrR family transcriptional regulator
MRRANEPADATTRARLLRAAGDAFAREGFAGARVDAIARDAGCNKQLVYHYFGDKAGLYEAVVRDVLATRPPLGALTRESIGPQIDRILEEELPARRSWLRMLAWEALDQGDGPVVAEDLRRAHLDGVVREIEAAQAAGVVEAKVPARLFLLAMMALVLVPYLLPQLTRLVVGMSPETPAFRRAHATMLRAAMARLGGG